ncbi:MAG: hypothetical protein FWG02_03210 [Holophagaceae bacterium]|nr:hypothetical protein [Holophagaceae bacterium]
MRRKVAFVLTRSGAASDAKLQYRYTPAWTRKEEFKVKSKRKKRGESPTFPNHRKLFFYIMKRRQGLFIVLLLKHTDKGHHLYLD